MLYTFQLKLRALDPFFDNSEEVETAVARDRPPFVAGLTSLLLSIILFFRARQKRPGKFRQRENPSSSRLRFATKEFISRVMKMGNVGRAKRTRGMS